MDEINTGERLLDRSGPDIEEIISFLSNFPSDYFGLFDESLDYNESFVNFSSYKRKFETLIRPQFENGLNEVIESLSTNPVNEVLESLSAKQLRGEAIGLAIEKYGLKPPTDDTDLDRPSTSSENLGPDCKRLKTEPSLDDVMFSAVGSAITDMGLQTFQNR